MSTYRSSVRPSQPLRSPSVWPLLVLSLTGETAPEPLGHVADFLADLGGFLSDLLALLTDLLTDATTFLTDRFGDLLGVLVFHNIFEVFGALIEPVDDLTSNLAAFPTHDLGDLLGSLPLKIRMEPLARAKSGGVANFLTLQIYFRFLLLHRILNALRLKLGWSGSISGRPSGTSGRSHHTHESQTEGHEGSELSHSGG